MVFKEHIASALRHLPARGDEAVVYDGKSHVHLSIDAEISAAELEGLLKNAGSGWQIV